MIENISTIVIALSAVVTAGATIVLAKITYRYVKTADEALKASDTPKVQVSLISQNRSYDIWTVDFCVQNIGTGFAYDIKFTGDLPSLHPQTSRGSLADYPIIKNGISHLGPGKRYQIPIIWKDLKLDPPERTFDVGVTYRNSAGTKHEEEYCLDFTKYEGYTQIGDPSIDSIARSLSHIEKTLREMEKNRTIQISNTKIILFKEVPMYENKTLVRGDNLEKMQQFRDECIDLIATDPPFNSKRNYFVPFPRKKPLKTLSAYRVLLTQETLKQIHQRNLYLDTDDPTDAVLEVLEACVEAAEHRLPENLSRKTVDRIWNSVKTAYGGKHSPPDAEIFD